MLVIVSWHSDGSDEPRVEFRAHPTNAANDDDAIGLLIETIRETRNKECRVYDVNQSAAVLYDSTIKGDIK